MAGSSANLIPKHSRVFGDPKNVFGGLLYFGQSLAPAKTQESEHVLTKVSVAVIVPLYSYAYFAPTIVRTLGYTVVETQLHTVPPVAAAFALCLINAYLSDRLRLRLPFIAFGIALLIAGLSILLTIHAKDRKYAGIYLVAMGAFSSGPTIVCWYVMNLRGHAQRSIGTAWMIRFGNTGGIVATFSFLAADAPFYHSGYSICMRAACLGAFAATFYAGLVRREKKMRRTAQEKHASLSLSL